MATRRDARTLRPLRPKALRIASPEAQRTAADLSNLAHRLEDLEADLSDFVYLARDQGLSWDAIGYCIGTSGGAARKRWGVVVDQADEDDQADDEDELVRP